jgi:L-lactate dehydrogenase complex protein LldG
VSAPSDRELILGRIRSALGDVPADEAAAWARFESRDPATAYLRGGEAPAQALTEQFAGRCAEYRANVVACDGAPGSLAAAVAAACARHGVRTLAIPADLDESWLPAGVTIHRDAPPLALSRLDACDGVLTGCAIGIALTGTIVLDAGAGQGRRALSLLPDLHICVVRGEQIVDGVPAAFDRIGPALRDGRPVTLISGPSATSDIELRRVEGVHGPRRLEVIVVSAIR